MTYRANMDTVKPRYKHNWISGWLLEGQDCKSPVEGVSKKYGFLGSGPYAHIEV